MAYTAADVKKLRETTGSGMLDCKKALEETDGDFEKAEARALDTARMARASGQVLVGHRRPFPMSHYSNRAQGTSTRGHAPWRG